MNHIGLEFEDLDKSCCYSFVLQHPKNRIVVPIKEPAIILTNKYKIENNEVFNNNSFNNATKFNILKMHTIDDNNFKSSVNYTGNEWRQLITHFYSENLPYQLQGVVIWNNKGERTKIRNPTYEKIKHLKGNSPKLQYQYYYLRQNNAVKDFLTYYPEYKGEFSDFRKELHKYTNQLYQNYIKCFIRKEKPLGEFPYQYKTHMYKIHEIYLNDLKMENKFVNKKVVMDYVNTLPPPRLMYSINHVKKQYDKDQKIVTSDLKVLMKSEM